jgi:MFS family permease
MPSRPRAGNGPLREVLRLPALRRLALAYFGFISAEFAVWVAMLVYAYDRGGSKESALVAVLQLVPAIAVAPLAGAIVERRDSVRVLHLGYVALSVALALTALALAVSAPALVVYAAATVATCTMTVTRPAQAVITPEVARTPGELTAVNLVAGWAESAAIFLAPALAGLLLGLSGPAAVYAMFACVAIAAAVLTSGVQTTPAGHLAAPDPAPARLARDEMLAGLRTLRDQPPVRLVVVVITAGFAIIGALDVLTVVLAVSVLDLGDGGAGYLVAAIGAGGVLGSLASAALVGRRHLAPALIGSALVCGAALMILAGVTNIAGVVALLAVVGMTRSVLVVAGNTLLQRSTPPATLARVFGLVEALSLAGLCLGSVIVPVLVAVGGSEAAFIGVGAILPLVIMMRLQQIRRIDRTATVPVVELALLRGMRIFASLPAPAIEGLARSAETVEAPAGTYIIREGDVGDRYYAIADGQVQIRRAGVDLGTRGRGEGVGETALLRNVPRTADVIADGPTRMLALDRTSFLVAVTGHEPARLEADRIIDERD